MFPIAESHIWLVAWCTFQHGFVETDDGVDLSESQEPWDVGCCQLYHLQTFVDHLPAHNTLYDNWINTVIC